MTPVAAPEGQAPSHLHPRPSFAIEDHPLPGKGVEIWRFTPADQAMGLVGDADDDHPLGLEVDLEAPDAVVIETLEHGQAPWGTALVPVDRPSALVEAKVRTATLVRLPEGVHLDEPAIVDVRGDGLDRRAYDRVVIEAEPGSSGIVVLRHTGEARYLANVEVVAGDEANLTVVSIQDWARRSLHAGFTQASVGRDAHLRHVVVSFGGAFVRLQTNVAYAGPGGTAELFGLYLADAGQYLEHRLFVDQNAPHTTSRVDYRGALAGAGARTAWVGDVLIRRGAEGVDSYEQNRNLLLAEGCVADSVPNLEIETGDIVGAGHSSSTGRFDDEQLFYLQSRGIPADQARRLIVEGFFGDIIRRIGVPDVEERLRQAVSAELDALEARGSQNHPADKENHHG